MCCTALSLRACGVPSFTTNLGLIKVLTRPYKQKNLPLLGLINIMVLVNHHKYQNFNFLRFFFLQTVLKLAFYRVRKSNSGARKVIKVWRYALTVFRLFKVFQYISLYCFYLFYNGKRFHKFLIKNTHSLRESIYQGLYLRFFRFWLFYAKQPRCLRIYISKYLVSLRLKKYEYP